MSLGNILSGPMVERIGWMLIHFLWQGAALALLLAVALLLLRKSKANVRYVVACVSLALMALVPCVTVFVVPVSESGFESATVSTATLALKRELVEPAEVVSLSETEPVSPKKAAPLVGPVSSSYSWREQAEAVVEPILPYLVLCWLVGVFGLSLWHLGGWTQLQRLRRTMVKPIGPPVQSRLKELAKLLGIHRAVQIMESALVRVPTVVGWLRPVILLPASALTGLTSEQLEAILAHELAHIRRYDYLVNLLQTVVEILGFYHPAVWWVSHKIRIERENCCDDLAVSVCGDRLRYARALTLLEEIRGGQPRLAVAASGVSLLGRIRRLVGKGSRENKRCSWAPAVIALLLILSLAIPTTLALSGRQEKRPDVEVEVAESKFTAVLSNGVTVELVGLYYGEGTKDVVFWKADGSSFSDSESQKYRERVVFPEWGSKYFRFKYGLVIRFGPLDELNTEVFVKQGQRMSYSYPRSDGIAIALVASDWNDREEGFSKVGNIKAAAAYGAWETRKYTARIKEPSVLYLDEHSNIMLSPPRRTDEWLVDVTINADNIDFECYYELKDGSTHQAKYRGTMGHPNWIGPDQRTPMICKRYALSHEPKEIREYIIKYRRFEIVEFKNVSLKPGTKTNVEIKGQARPAGEISDARRKACEQLAAQGWELWRQRKFAEAEEKFEQAAQKDPTNADVFNGLGWSQFNQGKVNAAEESFQKCLQLKPKHPAALNGLGWLAKQKGKTDEAIARWEKAIKASPNATAAVNGLADTYMELKQYDKAVKYYQMWLKLEPQNAQAKAGLERAKNADKEAIPDRFFAGKTEEVLTKEKIEEKIKILRQQRDRVQEELRATERALEEVRKTTGFTDLEETGYPHPITQRLIRLEKQRDDCLLEIAQLRAKIEHLEKQGVEGLTDLKKARQDYAILQAKLEQLEQMFQEAVAKNKELDEARVMYRRRMAIRDERKRVLESIKAQIEKLRVMFEQAQADRR